MAAVFRRPFETNCLKEGQRTQEKTRPMAGLPGQSNIRKGRFRLRSDTSAFSGKSPFAQLFHRDFRVEFVRLVPVPATRGANG